MSLSLSVASPSCTEGSGVAAAIAKKYLSRKSAILPSPLSSYKPHTPQKKSKAKKQQQRDSKH
jgi:hypothetical protein